MRKHPVLSILRATCLLVAGLSLLLHVDAAGEQRQEDTVCTAPWSSLGSNVYVHFKAVGDASSPRATWTWCFINKADRKITYFEFGYSDLEGEHVDVLPGILKPDGSFGGWAAFTSTGRPTRMWIRKLTYAGEQERGEGERGTGQAPSGSDSTSSH